MTASSEEASQADFAMSHIISDLQEHLYSALPKRLRLRTCPFARDDPTDFVVIARHTQAAGCA